MRKLRNDEYKLIEQLVSVSQDGLKRSMEAYLQTKYSNVIITKEYIVAVGDIPIALVAHMDTVFKCPVRNLFYDQNKNVLWSPEGLGADDRAGVFAIIQVLKTGLRPSVILTTDEEKGGVGAAALGEKNCPIPGLKYMIELDRRGTNDCVFYDCYNPQFTKYVEQFGFVERPGSFSDISFLMSAWDICGVNLSIGYCDEHSVSETLWVAPMLDTIRKVCNMLREKNIPDFKYEELYPVGRNWWRNVAPDPKNNEDPYDDYWTYTCCKCKKPFSEYEIFPVKGLVPNQTKFYCPDCITGNVDWCMICGEPYEIGDPAQVGICNDCSGRMG